MEDLPGAEIFHNFALLMLWFPFISEGLITWQYADGSNRRVFWFLFTVMLAVPFKTVSPVCSLGLLVGVPEIPTTSPHLARRASAAVIRWSRLSGGSVTG